MAKTPSTSATTKAAPKKPAAKKPAATAKAAATAADPKAKFTKAIEEARAGAQALAGQAQEKAGAYRAKAVTQGEAILDEAKEYGAQAKEKATELAREGKTKASEAISGLGKIVADTAPAIDEKLGAKYGDYARTAARTMQESAAKLEAKDLGELGNDAKEFVKKSPGLAVGIAAVAGFVLARLFKGGSRDES
ncbi:hypothetical protein [Novosphingobium sp. TH158]|uniref:hypothetical protein n=1 Tax=Novosphingobium sp. TH158 TaxID=2067455 RepID=UPI000C7D030A|nr:hypothetical protein [Novosphingobium sp. TH158]PLK25968.1 hypothetical protein C0V78_02985 [Novosphingobium sp. TH158]